MAVVYTGEQQKVIELRGRNILVSAAAGSGKTAVLVERIIQMISDENKKTDIDRLLVVTFTNAAAAEMRERIGQAIDERLATQPANGHLQRQAALLHNAQITTIDSFCLFIIRNNFNDIGLDPGFRVADEGEIRLLKQDVLTELLERKYADKEQDFISCVEYFTGGSNDKLLEEYIERLYEFSMSNPWPEEWLEKRKQDYSLSDVEEIESSEWCRYMTEYIRTILGDCAEKLDKAKELSERPEGPWFYAETLEKESEMLSGISSKESFDELYEAKEGIVFGRLPGKKDDSVDEDLKGQIQKLRNEVKKQIEEIKTDCFLLSPGQILDRMEVAAGPVATLVELVLQFKKALDQAKREENIIDFHDMEHFALKILLNRNPDGTCMATPAALEYRQFFHEILIDEYQDSNLVQELLLAGISGEEDGLFNRFMVGDVKQSIYKFRLARPELFIEKYNCYTKTDSDRQRIDLHKNFRSRPEVIDSVNRIFTRIMGKNLGGVEYDEEAQLYPGAEFPEYGRNETETILIGKDPESRLSVREQEAVAIADKIRELVRDFQVTDHSTGQLRPVRYSDIVILLRTASGWAEEFKGIFEKKGIPAYISSGTGYFETTEVRELLQLLHVLDNPLQDIPLYGVLKSFFGGFAEEELALVRSSGGKKAFLYENLVSYEGEGRLRSKLDEFLAWLTELRKKASYTPIHRLIQEVLTQTGYLEYVLAKPAGQQRHANVEMLLTRAAAFEHTSYYGLFHFLRYMEQLEKYQVDYGEADILDENADVVRIMSIHKSKGLEFPICFLSGLAKRFNRQDTTGRLIADVDMGIGVDYVDSALRLQSRTLRKNAIAMKLKLDSLGEEIRILYVAMTRAREKMFLTGVVADCDKQREEMELFRQADRHERLSFTALASAGSYLDFLLPCLENVQWVYPGENVMTEVRDSLRIWDAKQKLLLSEPDNKLMTQMTEKFEKTYPFGNLTDLFVKTTVSELKKAGHDDLSEESMEGLLQGEVRDRSTQAFTKVMFEEPEIVPYIPSFIKEKEGLSGTDRGSAYHKIMELLDFKYLFEKWEKIKGNQALGQEVQRQMEEMERSGKITSVTREAVAVAKIVLFLQTPLAKRMMKAAKAGCLYKEQPFVLGLPANRLNPAFPETETVLIQGIIDVFFLEGDRIVVADYKTDRVDDAGELKKRYQVQLDYYGEALERLLGKKIQEKIIYSFALNKEIALEIFLG